MEALIFLTEGFEEIEAVATMDILRRGGVFMHAVSLTRTRTVIGKHNIAVTADYTFGGAFVVKYELFDGAAIWVCGAGWAVSCKCVTLVLSNYCCMLL